jgi:hypothetical protein
MVAGVAAFSQAGRIADYPGRRAPNLTHMPIGIRPFHPGERRTMVCAAPALSA